MDLLSPLVACTHAQAASTVLASKACTSEQRAALAQLAGLEDGWVTCDQEIRENVADLCSAIVAELCEPFWFLRKSLSETSPQRHPRSLFGMRMATAELRFVKGFWTARSGLSKQAGLLALADPRETFDAVVHFVQAGGGTGVHLGHGRILTCAHVVEARDDEAADTDVPCRLGRRKLVMFANMRTFICECRAVEETKEGSSDVAVLQLVSEVGVQGETESLDQHDFASLPAAALAEEPACKDATIFCVGNPSSKYTQFKRACAHYVL